MLQIFHLPSQFMAEFTFVPAGQKECENVFHQVAK